MTLSRREWLATLMVQPPTFRASAQIVVVPLTVTNSKGKRVAGLSASDFVLSDNGEPREFTLEDVGGPVSLILAVETAQTSAAALDKLRRTAGLFQPLLAGHDGEIGLLAYDDEVRLLAPLQRDSAAFDAALRGIRVNGAQGHQLDAIMQAVEILKTRPGGRRRVLVIVGESKDLGSKAKLDQAIGFAQQANVTIYPVTYSRTTTPFTSREPLAGNSGVDILGALRELGRLGQANTSSEIAQFTGGWTNSFTKAKGLEDALQRVGDELHLQYVLEFKSTLDHAGEYRKLAILVKDHPEYVLRHRPGYWIQSMEPAGL